MSLSKISITDDAILRERVVFLMSLRNEKLTHVAKSLNLDPGGFSGWISGIQNRLSIDKKKNVSDYLGLKYTFLRPNMVHKFFTDSETLEQSIPSIISNSILERINIIPIFFCGQPSCCAYLSSYGEDVFVIIAQPRNKSLPPPIVSPEKCGWGIIRERAFYSVEEANTLISSNTLDARALYLDITLRSGKVEPVSVSDWAELLIEVISSGMSLKEAKKLYLNNRNL